MKPPADPRLSPLAATPLAEVLAALAEVGISSREAAFVHHAAQAVSAREIAERWLASSPVEPGEDQSFVREAAVELWRRWLPRRPCAELLAPLVTTTMARGSVDVDAADLTPLLEAFRALPHRSSDLLAELSALTRADVVVWLREVHRHLPADSAAALGLQSLLPLPPRPAAAPSPGPASAVPEPAPPAQEPPPWDLTDPGDPTARAPQVEPEPPPVIAAAVPSATAGAAGEPHSSHVDAHPPGPNGFGPGRVTAEAVGRNDPCPCGSGRKYKRCHLGKPLPAQAS